MRKLLETLFLLSLLLIGWGTLEIKWGGDTLFTLYGTTWESFFPLFFLYLICRIYKKDWKKGAPWKDPFLLFGLFAALSALWNPIHDCSMVLDYYLPALAAFITFRYLLSCDFAAMSSRFWPYYLGALALTVLRGIIEKPALLSNLPSLYLPYQQNTHLDTPFFHHNHIAMNLVLGIPLALGYLRLEPRKRVFTVAMLLIMLAGLILSNSRSGWVAFGVTAAYLILRLRVKNLRFAVLAFTAVFLVLMCSFSLTRSRLFSLAHFTNDSSLGCRMRMWVISRELFRDHPLVGIGFSNRTFSSLEILYSRDLSASGIISQDTMFDPHPHNLYIQIAVYLGLAGFIIFLWMVLEVSCALITIGENDQNPLMLPFFVAGFLGFLTANLADTVFYNTQTTLLFLLIPAYALEWSARSRAGAGSAPSLKGKEGTVPKYP
ncbi:MAG: O-antigen ligase family protein [Candidatus Eremiobacteraeota bacterium]|nr:O-antigen ligase family protein [Candidatus Eremiobacteraeota bacterium]